MKVKQSIRGSDCAAACAHARRPRTARPVTQHQPPTGFHHQTFFFLITADPLMMTYYHLQNIEGTDVTVNNPSCDVVRHDLSRVP